MDRPKRAAAAAAAAALSTRQPQQQQHQQQQKRKQQKSKQEEEEEEDAALPAEEEEIGDDDEGSDSESSEEGQESEQGSGADAGSGDDVAEEEGDQEAEGEEAAEEGEQSGEEAEGEENKGSEEQSGSEAEVDGDDGPAAQDDDEQEDGEEAEEGDEADAAVGDSTPAASEQQGSQQQSKAPGRPPKGPQQRGKAAAAKPLKPVLKPIRDYSYVLQLPKHEQQSLVSQAEKIRKFRHSARATPACPEPKRNKTHWDHLLEEAEWMAKEFQRERNWKLKQAKRFVRSVKASKLDVESRAEVRAAEELAALRRKASWIGKQVQGFWKKAERVVNYKVYVAIEARKREVLDKHLDMIVGQTEAFSKMLAQNLVGPEQQQQPPQQLALPPPATYDTDAAAAAGAGRRSSGGGSSGGGGSSRRPTRSASGLQVDPPSTSPQQQEQQQQQQQGKHVAASPAHEQMQEEDAEPEDETVAALAGDLLPDAEQPEADAAAAAPATAVDAHEQQQQQGTPAAGAKRRRSSTGGGECAAAAKAEVAVKHEAAADADAPDASERRPKRARRSVAPKPAAAAAAAAATPAAAGSSKAAAGKRGMSARPAADADADFQSAEEESDDDEATLEEEERLAEGDVDNAADKELDELDEEANMPIEQLLARYGFVVPDGDAEQQHHDSSDEQEEEEDEQQQSEQQQQQDGKQEAAADSKQQQQPGKKPNEKAAAAADDDDNGENPAADDNDGEAMVAASRDAAAAQPTGFTLATTQVKTPVPFLLKHTLREYQHIGLDWLVSLYEKKLNGILADEMGLGKTIQTVALLAYLACEEGVWGPHLVVVPTSVMLNWEMEFKKWCPAFKLLTYYGSAKERKAKRQGWSKPHAFHVCITSYTLVLQDAKMFRRKKWKYLILDEAHMIKNWKSQRWQTLLRFNSKRRLLITGTPLQNDLMELWSLMHFLMPAVFSSHAQFKDWFSNPLTGAVETGQEVSGQLVERLHGVLRPFLLRRLKSEVEKQMPAKHEHVLTCRLSKRQRQLYDEYMARAETRAVMSGGNFMGVINVLMQLRKVCNHPDLFEGRAIVSAYDMPQMSVQLPSLAFGIVQDPYDACQHWSSLGLLFGEQIGRSAVWAAAGTAALAWSPSDFAAVAADAAVSPTGFAEDPSALFRAGAAAAVAAGLVVEQQKQDGSGLNGMGSSRAVNAAAAAAAQATDAVRQTHAQLMMTSGAAVALTGVLSQTWQKHAMWRLSRVAHAAVLSLQRCGVDVSAFADQQQRLGFGSSSSSDVIVSGGWLPTDACGVPVGAAARGRFPDAAAFQSTAVARSQLLLPSVSPGFQHSSSAPANGMTAGATAGGLVSNRLPLCGWDLVRAVGGAAHPIAACLKGRMGVRALADLPSLVLEVSPTYEERAAAMEDVLVWFMFAIPKARGRPVDAWCSRPDGAVVRRAALAAAVAQQEFFKRGGSLRTALVRRQLFFPDRRLLQYDCGKLQELDVLLRKLKAGGHRVLIFTQMAKMLDVLEAFLNLHGHVYMRLDGSTKPEQRQVMMSRFNSDPKYFVFILSTRSGGVGINLTGADTVVFYDSDWNPAMDAQAQDRCHRIGQTREVHIYRLISANTIEENILRKSDQKRQLDWLAIQSGGFNTEMLAKLNLGGGGAGGLSADDLRAALRSAEDEDDAAAAAVAEKEAEAEMAEFTNEPPPEELKDEDLEGLEGLEGDDAPSKAGGGGTRAGTPASASTVPPPPPTGGRGRGHRKQPGAAAKHANRAASPAAADGEDSKQQGPSAGEAKEAEKEENAEEEARDLVMKDLATLQEGQSGQDLISRLSSSLKPIELYAVKWLEEQRPVDVAAAAAAAVEDIQKEEWDLDAIEKRKEQQEAEAEDSDEVIEGWDKAAADAAYQDYQKQIAAVLAAEEEAAVAAAAAAAEEAELAAAELAAAEAAGYSYPAEYSGYGMEGAGGGLEVTSPGSGRPKREAAAGHWSPHGNLPSHFQQQQHGMPAWQPYKKQRGIFGDLGGGSGAAVPGGRGRGRGRVGRPPGRGRGRAGGYASTGSQGGLYSTPSVKEDIWEYNYGDEDDSSNLAAVWQMLEEGSSLSSQCWLLPAAAVAEQQQIDALLPGTFASSNSKPLLPWELQWDPPLVQLVAAIASAAAGFPPDLDATDPAVVAAVSSAIVDVHNWGMLEWDQVAAQLKDWLVPPAPRTALNRRVHWISCRDRYLQLLQDFQAVQQYHVHEQQAVQLAAAPGSTSSTMPSTGSSVDVLPQQLDAKLTDVVQKLPPAAQQLLDSLVGATAAAAAAAAATGDASQAALQQQWQHYKSAPAAAPVNQQQQLQPVSLAAVQQLSATVDAAARSTAAAASAIAAAATAASGISTRRQSEGVKQAVGGPNALVLAPSASQMMAAMEELDGDVLGAGSGVHWGATHTHAAVLSPTLARAASLAGAAGASGGVLFKQGSEAAAAVVKHEPYSDAVLGGRALQQQSFAVQQQPHQQQYMGNNGNAGAAAVANGHYGGGSYQSPAQHAAADAAAANGALAGSPSPAVAAAAAGWYQGPGADASVSAAAAHDATAAALHAYSPSPGALASNAAAAVDGNSGGRGRGRIGRPPGRGRGRGRSSPGGGNSAAAAAHAAAAAYSDEQHMQQQALQHAQYYGPAGMAGAVGTDPFQRQQQQLQLLGMGPACIPASSGMAVMPAASAYQQQQSLLGGQQQLQLLLGGQQSVLLQQLQQTANGTAASNAAAAQAAAHPAVPQQALFQQQQWQHLSSGAALPAAAAPTHASAAVIGSGGGLMPNAFAALLAQQQLQQQLQLQLQHQQQQAGVGQQAAAAAGQQAAGTVAGASAPMLTGVSAPMLNAGTAGSYYLINQQPMQPAAAAAVPEGMVQQNLHAGGMLTINPMQLLQLQQQQQLKLAAMASAAASQQPPSNGT